MIDAARSGREGRSGRARRAVDACFACAIAATIVLAIRARDPGVPVMPDGFVATTAITERPQLRAPVAIAAVFADIHGPRDFTGWSVDTLSRELVERGFVRQSSSRFTRADATVDVIRLPDERAAVEGALNVVLATHQVVYYNGHNFGGSLALASPPDRVVVFDSCWSAQHYAALGTRATLVANTERAITGSIFSFLPLLDGLLARDGTWNELLATMNDAALARAAQRADSEYPEAERYAVVRRR